MRAEYWKFLYITNFNLEYFALVYNKSRAINTMLTTVPYIVSTAIVTTWAIWEKFPLLWAIIVAICQIVSLCRERFPWYQREITLKYTLPKLRQLATELECFWSEIEYGEIQKEEIIAKLPEFKKKSEEIDNALVEMDYKVQEKQRKIAIKNNDANMTALYGLES